jgi:hypothetical protein
MSDDDFMLSALRTPPAALVKGLKRRLAEIDAEPAPLQAHLPPLRWAAAIAGTLVLGSALALPPVRAAAKAFLDLFRVVEFAPVPVGNTRLEALLGRRQIDLPQLLGDQSEAVRPPGKWQRVASPADASAVAHIPIGLPSWTPVGFRLQRIEVLPSQAWRFTANASKLQGVLDSLGIDDVSVPTSIDGQAVSAHIAAIVRVLYAKGGERFAVIESRQPLVFIPPGIDLSKLAQIALRVLGVGSAQAYRLAQSVDWRTTLIVPVPADVAAFRKVDVQGHSGLLMLGVHKSGDGKHPGGSRLVWSTGDRVFAIVGNMPPDELFNLAQSFQ